MMSKRIRYIVAVVSLALLGVFALQGYWLYNAYRLSEDEFEKQVADVAKRLEKQYVQADLAALNVSEAGGSSEQALEKLADFLLQAPRLAPNMAGDSAVTDFNYKVLKVDTARIAYDGESQIHTTESRAAFGITDSAREIINLNATHDYSPQQLERLGAGLSLEVDSILQLVGINTAFALRLSNLSGNGDEVVTNSTISGKADNLPAVTARIGLRQPFRMALVVIPDTAYIVHNMLWALIASALISAAVVWAFVLMLRTMLQQKRLSDIKSDFINNMTHEFKTPIATVSLAVEALQHFNVMEKPEQTREYLGICRHELKRISVMVEKVLKMASFERTEADLSIQQTDIGKLVADVVENMRPQLEKRGASVKVMSDEKAGAKLDRAHMANVIGNLIENGLKYSEETPQIKINYGVKSDDSVWMTVQDNGIGIPATYRDRIFENFFRVPTGNLHNAKGFGLGLGYVATIIKKHRGRIDVKSTLGKGSTFTITLPAM